MFFFSLESLAPDVEDIITFCVPESNVIVVSLFP